MGSRGETRPRRTFDETVMSTTCNRSGIADPRVDRRRTKASRGNSPRRPRRTARAASRARSSGGGSRCCDRSRLGPSRTNADRRNARLARRACPSRAPRLQREASPDQGDVCSWRTIHRPRTWVSRRQARMTKRSRWRRGCRASRRTPRASSRPRPLRDALGIASDVRHTTRSGARWTGPSTTFDRTTSARSFRRAAHDAADTSSSSWSIVSRAPCSMPDAIAPSRESFEG